MNNIGYVQHQSGVQKVFAQTGTGLNSNQKPFAPLANVAVVPGSAKNTGGPVQRNLATARAKNVQTAATSLAAR